MKWPKRLIVTGVAMLTAAAALTLTACSKNSDSSNDGKVTIEYFNQKTEMVDTLKEIIKDFEKENPCQNDQCAKCWYCSKNTYACR